MRRGKNGSERKMSLDWKGGKTIRKERRKKKSVIKRGKGN